MGDLKTQAIEAALRRDWQAAVELNENLLKDNANDIETLNRLAFALMQKGDLAQAKKYYKKILTQDPFNPIATKNLNNLVSLRITRKVKMQKPIEGTILDLANLFLEETGKTKVVKLANPAESHIISVLKPGDEVFLSVRRRGVLVLDQEGTYLGALPDDISHKIIQFIKYGNKYQSYVKSIDKNIIVIFIKEVKRAPRFKNQPSFSGLPPTYLTSVREEVLEEEEKPQVATFEELEEEEQEEGSQEQSQ